MPAAAFAAPGDKSRRWLLPRCSHSWPAPLRPVLATARPDGRPQAAPISYLVRDGAFWFATVAGARLHNLRASPYPSFVVSEGEEGDHRVVMAEGVVRLHEPTGELAAEWAKRHGSVPIWAAAFLELVPERVFSYAAPPGSG